MTTWPPPAGKLVGRIELPRQRGRAEPDRGNAGRRCVGAGDGRPPLLRLRPGETRRAPGVGGGGGGAGGRGGRERGTHARTPPRLFATRLSPRWRGDRVGGRVVVGGRGGRARGRRGGGVPPFVRRSSRTSAILGGTRRQPLQI